MISDEDFAKKLLVKGLSKKYKDEVIEIRKKLRSQIKHQDKTLGDNYASEINQMELHDQLVSMSVFPFIQNSLISNLGYQFVRAAPLIEKGVKNLDFLIYRKNGKTGITIFGEAKTSISNRTKIINEYNERIKEINANRKYILEEYLGNPSNVIFEFVLSVFSPEAAKMKESIEQSGGGLILWSADLAFSDLRLEGSRNPNTRSSMSHSDSDLSRTLNKISTAKKSAILFQQSHIVTKLKSIITVKEVHNAINRTKTQKFKLSDFDEYLKKVLFYLSDNEREKEKDMIITKAIELKLIEKINDDCIITISQRNNRGQEAEFARRWIQNQVSKKREEKTIDEITKLRDKYSEMDKSQPRLFD